MIKTSEHFICKLAQEYNQLYLPIRKGISKTSEYRNVVLKGYEPPNRNLNFTFSKKDLYQAIDTKYGQVKCMYIYNRLDFENIVRKLAHKCEPVEIPKTMGSIVILRLNNWRKIKFHKQKYELMGNSDWKQEFKRFTSVKRNYQDSLIIISDGNYSNLSHKYTSFNERRWKDMSINIRKYHELTHFICMKKYPKLKQPIFDEMLADCMGISFAMGYYDKDIASRCIGVTKEGYKVGGRLENYIDKNRISHEMCSSIMLIIDNLEGIVKEKMDKTEIKKEKISISHLEYLIDCVYNQGDILSQCAFLSKLSQ